MFTELLNDSGLRVDDRLSMFITFVFYLLIYRDAGAGSGNFCKIATNYSMQTEFQRSFSPVSENTLLYSVSHILRSSELIVHPIGLTFFLKISIIFIFQLQSTFKSPKLCTLFD